MKKMGFRFRMMIAIMTVAAVCVCAIAVFDYVQSKQELEENYVDTLESKLTIQTNRVDSIMREIYMEVNQMGCSDEIKEYVDEYLASERTYQDGYKVSNALQSLLTFKQYDSALYLYIYDTEQMFSSIEYCAVQSLDRTNILLWRNWSDAPYTPVFYMNQIARSSEYVFGYPYSIFGDDGKLTAMLCLTVNERQIYYDVLERLNQYGQSGEDYILVNQNGLICSAADVSSIYHKVDNWDRYSAFSKIAETDDEGMLNVSVEASFPGYRILCRSDMSSLTPDLHRRMQVIIALMLGLLVVIVLAAFNLSQKLYKPVNTLVDAMEQVGNGDFDVRVPTAETGDEFQVVGEQFNLLMSRMDVLMDRLVQGRLEKKEAEINALQYQIRPHFMYNTLNSIRFAATLQRNYKLADLLGDFIELLEASIQRKGAFITLKEEIELVKHFIALQSFRYMDCFEVIYSIEPETQDCYVPCLLLQPMVENAVFHGIDTKRTDNLIEINAWIENSELRISINDNGEGFELESEEDKEAHRRLSGIGMSNVEQRLKLYYGHRAFFDIKTEKGRGTTVEFTMPVSHDPEEYSIDKEGEQQ